MTTPNTTKPDMTTPNTTKPNMTRPDIPKPDMTKPHTPRRSRNPLWYFSKEARQNLTWIVVGTLFMALSANFFYTPADMVPGGFTGIAVIIRHLTLPFIKGGLPVWLGNLLLNIPLILAAIALRGWNFMRRTLIASLLFSLWLFVLPEYAVVSDDYLLIALFGGALMGIGLGLVFYGKATTGGTDTLAALFQKAMPHVGVAKILPALDGIVILLSIWIFGIRISLYAVLSVIICGVIADLLMSGFRNAYTALIISGKNQEIADTTMKELNRGATSRHGRGMYTDKDRQVLMIAVSKRQIADLKEIVCTIDPDAFMILFESREIRGEGFLQYSREEL